MVVALAEQGGANRLEAFNHIRGRHIWRCRLRTHAAVSARDSISTCGRTRAQLESVASRGGSRSKLAALVSGVFELADSAGLRISLEPALAGSRCFRCFRFTARKWVERCCRRHEHELERPTCLGRPALQRAAHVVDWAVHDGMPVRHLEHWQLGLPANWLHGISGHLVCECNARSIPVFARDRPRGVALIRAQWHWLSGTMYCGRDHFLCGLSSPRFQSEQRIMRSYLVHMIVCLLVAGLGWVPLASSAFESAPERTFPGWEALMKWIPFESPRQVELTQADSRFADSLTGPIARFEAQGRQILCRWLPQSTHRMHGARHCYQGLGYEIQPEPARAAFDSGAWGVFRAQRDSEHVRVYERIMDSDGKQFSDISTWYWSAELGSSSGPWLSVIVVERCTDVAEESSAYD